MLETVKQRKLRLHAKKQVEDDLARDLLVADDVAVIEVKSTAEVLMDVGSGECTKNDVG